MRPEYETELTQAQIHLRAARHAVQAEISAYPTPISGCDAQFNRLLSDRSRIDAALRALSSAPFVPTPRMPMPATSLESR